MGLRTGHGVSAAVLKNIAVITMTIDHATAFILGEYLKTQRVLNIYDNQWYLLGRIIGRIAFVLYAFMIAEGAYRTRSKAKYALRLLIMAVISIIPHSYVNAGKLFNPDDLNIFFLLFLGLITIYAYDWLRDNIKPLPLSVLLRFLAAAAASYLAIVLNMEYGMMGILLMLVFHIFRYDNAKLISSAVLIMSVGYVANVIIRSGAARWIANHSSDLIGAMMRADRIQIFGLLALPFILLYNGNKGKQFPKLFYYLYYPVHLGIIALIIYS